MTSLKLSCNGSLVRVLVHSRSFSKDRCQSQATFQSPSILGESSHPPQKTTSSIPVPSFITPGIIPLTFMARANQSNTERGALY